MAGGLRAALSEDPYWSSMVLKGGLCGKGLCWKALLGKLQPVGSPQGISSGRTACYEETYDGAAEMKYYELIAASIPSSPALLREKR